MALKFVKPSINLASLPNFCENASDRLCAGSVEMRRTERRTFASWIAREQDVVVFPTPPLPPTKIQRRDLWSRMDWREGERVSSVLIIAVDIVKGGDEVFVLRRCVRTCAGCLEEGVS